MQYKVFFVLEFARTRVYVKEGSFHVPPLPTTVADLHNSVTDAENSASQDMLLRVWGEFGYHLDLDRATNGGHNRHVQPV